MVVGYMLDKFHYEDWEVDNGEDDVSIISIVNDFFEAPLPFYPHIIDLEPLEYWVDDGGMGYQGSSYEECVSWIKENYLNSYKINKKKA